MKKTLICLFIMAMTFTSFAFAEKQKPFNRVVVIIDSSGTFKDHQYEAIEKVRKLFEDMAERKERRFEAPDQIYIISLDAKPEVIWAGRREHIVQLTKKKLSELFKDRRRYVYCTEIAAAFNLAAHRLNRQPIPTAKWLFVFSDLIDEPVISGRICKVPEKPSLPSEKIKWNMLSDTSISVFWAPDLQIMAWEDAVADKGLSIRFYNEAEARERISEWKELGKDVGSKALRVLVIFVIVVIFLVFLGNYFGRRRFRANVVNSSNTRRR